MGLIKSGLVLAGGYGLIKAVSRAANERDEKKQKRQNHNMHSGNLQMPYQTHNESQMGYMYQNQPASYVAYPQWGPSHEPQSQSYYEHPINGTLQQAQSRSINDSGMSQSGPMNHWQAPPPYSGSDFANAQANCKHGSAREYYAQ